MSKKKYIVRCPHCNHRVFDDDYADVEIKCPVCKKVFDPKIAVIKELIQEFRLETTLVVVINGESVNLPEMQLSEEIIAFAASINASIGFDMYLD